ncbi:hypothetical protein T12_9936, partial [Trichinella patagoniensis]
MNNEEKEKRKHGRFEEQADRGRHEAEQKVRQKNKKRQKVSSVAVGPDSVSLG